MTTWNARTAPSTSWAATAEFLRDTFAGGPVEITSHTADSGATWAYSDNGFSGVVTVGSGYAALTSGGYQEVLSSVTAPVNDYTITATVLRQIRTGTVQVDFDVYAFADFASGIVFDANLFIDVSAGNACTVNLDGPALSVSAQTAMIAANTPTTFALKVQGTTISVLLNDVVIVSGTDASIPARPSVAFSMLDNDTANGVALQLTDIVAATLPTAAVATAWTPRSTP